MPVTPLEIFRGGKGAAELRGFRRAGAFDRVHQHHHGVVAQALIASLAMPQRCLKRSLKATTAGSCSRRIVGGEVAALDGLAADLTSSAIPAVAPKRGTSMPRSRAWFADERRFGVVARARRRASTLAGLDGGELGAEILVAFGEFLLERDAYRHPRETLAEKFRRGHALGGRDGREDGRRGRASTCSRANFRHHSTLEGIDEADAEDVVAARRDVRAVDARRDQRDLRSWQSGAASRERLEAISPRTATLDRAEMNFFTIVTESPDFGLIVLGQQARVFGRGRRRPR